MTKGRTVFFSRPFLERFYMFYFYDLELSHNAKNYLYANHIETFEQLMVNFTPKKQVLRNKNYEKYANELLVLAYAVKTDNVELVKDRFKPIYDYIKFISFLYSTSTDEKTLNVRIKQAFGVIIPHIVRACLVDLLQDKAIVFKNNQFKHDMSQTANVYYLPFVQTIISNIQKGEKYYSHGNAWMFRRLRKYSQRFVQELSRLVYLKQYSLIIRNVVVRKNQRLSADDFLTIFPYENKTVYYFAKAVEPIGEKHRWRTISCSRFVDEYGELLSEDIRGRLKEFDSLESRAEE